MVPGKGTVKGVLPHDHIVRAHKCTHVNTHNLCITVAATTIFQLGIRLFVNLVFILQLFEMIASINCINLLWYQNVIVWLWLWMTWFRFTYAQKITSPAIFNWKMFQWTQTGSIYTAIHWVNVCTVAILDLFWYVCFAVFWFVWIVLVVYGLDISIFMQQTMWNKSDSMALICIIKILWYQSACKDQTCTCNECLCFWIKL